MTQGTKDNVFAAVVVAVILIGLVGLVRWSTVGPRAECEAKGGHLHYSQVYKSWSCDAPR